LQNSRKKSQEALSEAQNKAISYGHAETDGEHLLLALLEQPEGLISRILSRTGADPSALAGRVEQDLSRRPRVTGPGVEPGKIRISPACRDSS
jgi:ATPases with chaperone activity, ATP-binding subunit